MCLLPPPTHERFSVTISYAKQNLWDTCRSLSPILLEPLLLWFEQFAIFWTIFGVWMVFSRADMLQSFKYSCFSALPHWTTIKVYKIVLKCVLDHVSGFGLVFAKSNKNSFWWPSLQSFPFLWLIFYKFLCSDNEANPPLSLLSESLIYMYRLVESRNI